MSFEEDSEEPSEEEEFYENEEDGKEDNEATELHQPKVGGKGGMPPLPGGLPRPPNSTTLGSTQPVKPEEALSTTLDGANRSARGSEFRIKHNTSKGSLGATAGAAAYQNPAKKTTRPSLIGMNKPRMLKNQNEDIKRMLGMSGGPDELDKVEGVKAERKVGPGTRLQPVVRQTSATRGRAKLPGVDQESFAGTPS